jgi:butyrate kinase
VIAYELSKKTGVPAYIYDAVCGCGKPDELFTITGLPEIRKPFLTHVLNSRAAAIEQAKNDRRDLNKTAYIVVHLGGGVTVNLISGGTVRDFVGDDEGAFSPERAGGVPCRALTALCYSNTYSEQQMQKRLKGRGGMLAYLQTSSLSEAEKLIEAGDAQAERVVEAMAMQIAKDIGAMATVEAGNVDGIILTAGWRIQRPLRSA